MGWLNDWKLYVGYGGGRPSEVHPGMISNEKLLDVKERIVPVREPQHKAWLDRNLVDNLREDDDYVIVNPTIWDFLFSIFGGIEIR